ncbi:MAG: hypothetical protein P4L92_17260 [Rudaea sp.]|nr:hypothetical protein [Rudaea sp.]
MKNGQKGQIRPSVTALSTTLCRDALDGADHPADAVSALMSAAATILRRSFGEEGALALMTQALDTTGVAWRATRCN